MFHWRNNKTGAPGESWRELPWPSTGWLQAGTAVPATEMPAQRQRVDMAERLRQGSRQCLSLERIRTVSRQASWQEGCKSLFRKPSTNSPRCCITQKIHQVTSIFMETTNGYKDMNLTSDFKPLGNVITSEYFMFKLKNYKICSSKIFYFENHILVHVVWVALYEIQVQLFILCCK